MAGHGSSPGVVDENSAMRWKRVTRVGDRYKLCGGESGSETNQEEPAFFVRVDPSTNRLVDGKLYERRVARGSGGKKERHGCFRPGARRKQSHESPARDIPLSRQPVFGQRGAACTPEASLHTWIPKSSRWAASRRRDLRASPARPPVDCEALVGRMDELWGGVAATAREAAATPPGVLSEVEGNRIPAEGMTPEPLAFFAELPPDASRTLLDSAMCSPAAGKREGDPPPVVVDVTLAQGLLKTSKRENRRRLKERKRDLLRKISSFESKLNTQEHNLGAPLPQNIRDRLRALSSGP
ncbi:hypothetical protein A3770_06p45440 [Chloropicon primus]|uniref:Uncharacterized protein n=1 Tax=Chloropicon primus TaxID=1764295 RepID=A0A5B8MN80_9CHLO|nr:hypothetical protein A3770_06p45440 [Chloropicon primus]|eukprot:QDZ22026.1 hypothetical protein A3770_06p45440 [Chloropicon primus]